MFEKGLRWWGGGGGTCIKGLIPGQTPPEGFLPFLSLFSHTSGFLKLNSLQCFIQERVFVIKREAPSRIQNSPPSGISQMLFSWRANLMRIEGAGQDLRSGTRPPRPSSQFCRTHILLHSDGIYLSPL